MTGESVLATYDEDEGIGEDIYTGDEVEGKGVSSERADGDAATKVSSSVNRVRFEGASSISREGGRLDGARFDADEATVAD